MWLDESNEAKIVRFNFETFRLENESQYNAQQIASEREAAWSFFDTQIKPSVASWKNGLGPDYLQSSTGSQAPATPLWERQGFAPLEPYKNNISNFLLKNPHIQQNQASVGIFSLIKRLPYSIDEIKQDRFLSLYKPFNTKQDFLPLALGKVIWDYYIKLRTNQINDFENERYGKAYAVLTEEDFELAHGEKPWDIINAILGTFDSLEYRINSPEGVDVFGSYKLSLVHTSKPGLEIDFSSLSSGERVLMALVASIYKTSSDGIFPDILLLDELDASLHPSMIKNMLSVIDSIFLARGVKVLLVTHSPTTIALAPEESIYVMNRSGSNRIEKKSKRDALSILTEGFATLEEGLTLFDEVARNRVSIITEGKNTEIISRALQIFGISGVEVVLGAESISGKSQLKTLFDFFSSVVHMNKVIFVWDCDATFSLTELNNTVPFIFARNPENVLVNKGIENLFPSRLFNGFTKTIKMSSGEEIVQFDESTKSTFAAHVTQSATAEDFEKFRPLMTKIGTLAFG